LAPRRKTLRGELTVTVNVLLDDGNIYPIPFDDVPFVGHVDMKQPPDSTVVCAWTESELKAQMPHDACPSVRENQVREEIDSALNVMVGLDPEAWISLED